MDLLRTLKSIWRKKRGGAAQELADVRREKLALEDKLGQVRKEVDAITTRNAAVFSTLEDRIGAMETERAATQQQLAELRHTLAIAEQNQSDANQRIIDLGRHLEDERCKRQDHARETRLREQRQDRRLNLFMLVAVAALLLGALAGTLEFRDTRRTTELLAHLSNDIADIKAFVDREADAWQSQSVVPPAALVPAGADRVDGTTAAGDRPVNLPGSDEARTRQQAPAYYAGQVAHNIDHGRRTRQEMLSFFEENAAQEGIITLTDGLQYRVLNHGIGRSPGSNDRVILDYRAYLLNGTRVFDSHDESLPVSFRIDQLAPGLRTVLSHMVEGSQWEVYIAPDLAYRDSTRNRKRFGYEPLVYVVDLISVIDAEEDYQQ